MRFEIRTGGAFAILIGLGLLSGLVFVLGLLAGYEMGHQQEGNRQFASVYPLPAPPEAASSPSGAGPEAAPAPAAPIAEPLPAGGAPTPEAAASNPAVAPVASAPPPPAPVAAEPAPAAPVPVAIVPPAAVASEPMVASKPPESKLTAPEGSGSGRGEPEITAPVSPRHRGYSIQIEAVMDRSGADSMVAKLRHLGYEGYLVETLIGGETWYRVRIGPFATEAGAQAAEQKLHAQYNGSVSAP